MSAIPVGASTTWSPERSTPAARELGSAPLAEVVVADGADEADLGAEPGRGDRLVGALAARDAVELGARERLPRPRQPRDGGDEVEVDRADDRDARQR